MLSLFHTRRSKAGGFSPSSQSFTTYWNTRSLARRRVEGVSHLVGVEVALGGHLLLEAGDGCFVCEQPEGTRGR